MSMATFLRKSASGATALLVGLALCAAVSARAAAHDGGGRAVGGYHGGGYGGRGYYGGWHGYGGWRGGYGWYGGPGLFWGGLGLGLYFSALPLYYSTLWWDGVPYYYAANNYYLWNGAAGAYETVAPPSGLANPVAAPQAPARPDPVVYPSAGQSTEQQAKDRYECHRWAVSQSGYDPSTAGGVSMGSTPAAGGSTAAPVSAAPERRGAYLQAEGACLQGRGYTAK